jgi:ubiquinone/menaquinone biosynthesis C-methylase UbiE
VKLVANCKPDQNYLDVGCGIGRLIEYIKPNARRIVGLEPDIERFKICSSRFLDCQNIQILNSSIGEYNDAFPNQHFDLILLSMVLQHVPTATCNQILRDVHQLLAPNGVAIVATTHFFDERFIYTRDTTPRSSDEFDRYAQDTSNQPWDIPVRMFSRSSFLGQLEQAALEVIVWNQYCYFRPECVGFFANVYNVSAAAIKDIGVSQFAVVKRRGD